MDTKIPIKLRKEPLLEAVWEVRFSESKRSIADLMPGMIFKSLPDKYGNIVRLPTADIPAPIVENNPNLRYAPKIRLENGNQAVQIGEHSLSLSCRRPYSGWARFSADIHELIKVTQETGLIENLERFSLKYIDLIELEQPLGLSCLNLDLKLGEHEISTEPVQLRTELRERDLIHIIQIVSPAKAVLPALKKQLKGVLVDIDTIKPISEKEPWELLYRRLDDLHISCKRMFFSIVKHETIEKLGPEYKR